MKTPRDLITSSTKTRTRKMVTAAGVVGIAGALGAGGTVIASAASTENYENTASTCSGLPVPAPGAPVYEKTIMVGPNGTVTGVVPSPKGATTAAGVTAKSVRFAIRTQYDSPGSTAKSAVMDVTVSNHAIYHNPVLFAIPPVDNSFQIAPDEALTYTLQTRGRVASKVTIQEFVTDATGTVVLLGKKCPAGSTRVSFLQGQETESNAAGFKP
jgi:hypothetical protein